MRNLDEIQQYITNSTMILIINNHSKSLLNYVFDLIYNKYLLQKTTCDTSKGLMRKLINIKGKLIKIDFDLKKIQFSSSNNKKLDDDFETLKLSLIQNNSKLLVKTDLLSNKDYINIDFTNYYHRLPQYNAFDFILLIDKTNIKIIKARYNFQYSFFEKNENDTTFDITSLIRSIKLKKIQNKFKISEK